MVHMTAKDSEFSDKTPAQHRLERASGYKKIAMACLKRLRGP